MSSAVSRFLPKPPWLHVELPRGNNYRFLTGTLRDLRLHTVCEEAHCPNMGECWGGGTATFMIMGDICTRGCRFCAVRTGKKGANLDEDEPQKIAEAAKAMRLDYAVITSVNRDDLFDQGSSHFARVVRFIKENAQILVEVLIPDFRGDSDAIRRIVESGPDVIAHNVETVERLTPLVRDRHATYDQSLSVLKQAKLMAPHISTKSSVMLGLGETRAELERTFQDLRNVGVDFLTLGQYLQPSPKHLGIAQFVPPQEFDELGKLARSYGFMYVASGPLVRSSYRAGEFFVKSLRSKSE